MEGVKYSVDMISFTCRVDKQKFYEFVNIYFIDNPYVEYWRNNGSSQYRHNYNVKVLLEDRKVEYENIKGERELNSCGYKVMYQHNSERKTNRYWLKLEYNPNKVPIKGALEFMLRHFIFQPNNYTKVKSCDIAADIPINITKFTYDKQLKRDVMEYRKGSDDYTLYFGKGYGRVKIYNKKNEYKKQGKVIEGELTRYELSLGLDIDIELFTMPQFENIWNDKLFNMPSIPILYYNEFKSNEEIEKELKIEEQIVLKAILEDSTILEKMTRRIKNKYKKILEKYIKENDTFTMNKDITAKTIYDYIKSMVRKFNYDNLTDDNNKHLLNNILQYD